MAFPNLSEIVTTTLRNRTGELADNVTRNNAILTRLSSRGFIKPFGGGRTILQELNYANNTTWTRYSGYELLNIQPSDTITSAEFAIRQAAVAISISGLERLQNSGKEAVIDLLESRINNAYETMRNGLSYDMYSDGSVTGQMNGLQALVADSPSSGTVGGIDRATWTFWQNQAYSGVSDGGAAVSAANIRSYMNALSNRLVRGTDSPDLALADANYYNFFLESMQAIQRLNDPSADLARAGFTTLAYNGAGRRMDVVLDGGYQGTTSDGNTFGTGGAGAVGGCPANHMYMLNSKYIFYRPHRDRNCVPIGDDRVSVNQDAMVQIIGWAGNMTISNCFLQGVLKA